MESHSSLLPATGHSVNTRHLRAFGKQLSRKEQNNNNYFKHVRMFQELGIPHSPLIVLCTPCSESASQWKTPARSWVPSADITLSHVLHSSPSQSLEWLLVFICAPLPSQWHSKLGCFVTCVSSRIAAGAHLRTFIRKMMYEAEGTQLDFQSPDWGCCSSSWRSFWHADFAWFWYKSKCWRIKPMSQHMQFTVCSLSHALMGAPGQGATQALWQGHQCLQTAELQQSLLWSWHWLKGAS